MHNIQRMLTRQKPKLKVGKTKPKPDNYTDTSFQSKCEHIQELLDYQR